MKKDRSYLQGVYEGLRLAVRIIKASGQTKEDIIKAIKLHLNFLDNTK